MKVAEIYKKLEQGVASYLSSENYAQLLKTMSKFHSYSWHNSLLILMQNPTATYVAGYTAWQSKFHRQVRKGEKCIKIIAPYKYKDKDDQECIGYKAASVFDISQTDQIPDRQPVQIGIDELEGDIDNYRTIITKLEALSPVPVKYTLELKHPCNGCYNDSDKTIKIRDGMSPRQTIKTLIHEIAHASVHTSVHENKDQQTKETEAESIAFIVAQSLGIDTSDYSFPYISIWARDEHSEILKSSMLLIQQTANKIIKDLNT